MATIFQRNGIWQIEWSENGQTFRRSLRTSCESTAVRVKRDIEAQLEKERLIRLENNGVCLVRDLVQAYKAHAATYYRKGNKPTSQIGRITTALSALDGDLMNIRVSEFGPLALQRVRNAWVAAKLVRTTVNNYTGIIKHMFKWGVSQEMVKADVYVALSTVAGLHAGRSAAKESEPVQPVSEAHIKAVKELVPTPIRQLIDLQLATGSRAGELLQLRPCDIDQSGAIWSAEVVSKMEHRIKTKRIIMFGPQAKKVLWPLLQQKGEHDYLFSPYDAHRETHQKKSAEGGRRVNQKATPKKTARKIGQFYTTTSYRKAIQRACEEAGIPKWHPHQLRHNAATMIRAQFGLEAAQVYLGHNAIDATQLYAEKNLSLARDIASQVG